MSVDSRTVMRLDLHLHTHASWDSLSRPEALLARAGDRGIHRIAITDHNKLGLAAELFRRYPERIIPGEEVRTEEGIDLIGLYISTEIPKGTPAEDACSRIREEGGIVYLPHPYAPGKGGSGRYAEALAPLVDVVEVFNARLHPGHLNGPAEELAETHGKLRGAGSDAHTVRELGGAWVEVPRHDNTAAGLLEALAQGTVHGETAPVWTHVASTWAKIRKVLPG